MVDSNSEDTDMATDPSATTASEMEDVGTLKLVVETEGVRRDVTITVSPRPVDALGWADVIEALSDLVSAHPERF
jgi:hypothetical protein